MKRALAILALCLAGCSGPAEKALIQARSARTLAAEAAAVLALEREGRLSPTYADEQLQQARKELEATKLEPVRTLGLQAAAQIESRDVHGLNGAVQALVRLEQAYERAG